MSNNNFLSFLKGIIISVLSALLLVLLFAFIVKQFSLSSSVIKPVNQFLKIISVFLGVIFAVKGDRGLIKGLLFGIVVSILQFLLFRFIGGGLSFSLALVWEILLGGVVGAIFGIICVNLKLHAK